MPQLQWGLELTFLEYDVPFMYDHHIPVVNIFKRQEEHTKMGTPQVLHFIITMQTLGRTNLE